MKVNTKDAFVIARLPQDLKKAFAKAVTKMDTDVSRAIRSMIENYVKYNG